MLRRRLMNVARFARSAPTPCYQRDNAPPFASVPLFPDVFACTPRFLLSSPFFLSPPLLSIWKTRPEGETTRLCDECNYARRGTKVSWRKYASIPLLFRILDRLSEDLFLAIGRLASNYFWDEIKEVEIERWKKTWVVFDMNISFQSKRKVKIINKGRINFELGEIVWK